MRNPYLPLLATIQKVKAETYDTTTFTLKLDDAEERKAFQHRPGQFVELSVFGAGEAPFCVSSSGHGRDDFDISVRKVGHVTAALHEMGEGGQVGVRGPLGNWFPFEDVAGKQILFIGGGIGLFPTPAADTGCVPGARALRLGDGPLRRTDAGGLGLHRRAGAVAAAGRDDVPADR